MSLPRCCLRSANIRRPFSTSQRHLNAEKQAATNSTTSTGTDDSAASKPEPPSKAAIEPEPRNVSSHSHRKAFVKWVKTDGQQYIRQLDQPGKNYLNGKSHPFPLNPQFQPRTPTSEGKRAEIYEDWKSSMGLQHISAKYGLSLQRIEAVLKLQEVKIRWEAEGRKRMASYSDRMNSMLGVSETNAEEYEEKTNIAIDPGRQIFTLIPEAAQYTPADAARDLGRTPFFERGEKQAREFVERSKYERQSAFANLARRDAKDKEISTTSKPDTRWSYTFKDTATSSTLQRKQNGILLQQAQKKQAIKSKWT